MTVSATDKPTRRPPVSAVKSGPNVLQTMAGLRPEHVAFFGEYHASTDRLMSFTERGPVPEADPWKSRLDLTERLAKRTAR